MEMEILRALVGGVLIGLAASLMLIFNGRIMGVSGILSGLLRTTHIDRGWKLSFVLGVLFGGLILMGLNPNVFGLSRVPIEYIGLAGLLVGFGTVFGSGCTSGHGICGVTRLSPRSLTATTLFMLSGVLMVYLIRHLGVMP